MNKRKIYSILPLIVLLLVIYFPSASTYFELKLAPYFGSVYALKLDDGDVVYGKVAGTDFDWIKLTDVYYFQTLEINDSATKNLVSQATNTLISPENLLLINKDRVVSIEKVGENAKIIEIMKQRKQ